MKRRKVLVVGYPKSGNTWLSRILGDALNSPVLGHGTAKPLAEEGQSRKGGFVVHQLHMKPKHEKGSVSIIDAYTYNTAHPEDDVIAYIYRDPRDVAVSVYYYWHRETLKEALDAMYVGEHPIAVHGSWQDFMEAWWNVQLPFGNIFYIKYEDLLMDGWGTLYPMMTKLLETETSKNIKKKVNTAISRQSFDVRKEDIRLRGRKLNYGQGIQLHNMRKGISGDWKNHFTPGLKALAHEYWNEELIEYQFEKDHGWVDDDKIGVSRVPEK